MNARERLEEKLEAGTITPGEYLDELEELTERQERVDFHLAILAHERRRNR